MSLDTDLLFALNGLVGLTPASDWVVMFFASYLAWLLAAGCVVALYRAPYSLREKVRTLIVAIAATGIARFGVAPGIQYFYQRPRPFLAYPEIHALFTVPTWAFPSGHATFFAALSMVVYLHNKKWGTVMFVATALMTLGRVIAGVHYPSDIVAGAVVGVVVAWLVNAIAHTYKTKKYA